MERTVPLVADSLPRSLRKRPRSNSVNEVTFSLEYGVELASVGLTKNLTPPYERRTVGLNASYFAAFKEGEADDSAGMPVIETLKHILSYLETEVLPAEVLPRFMKHLQQAN